MYGGPLFSVFLLKVDHREIVKRKTEDLNWLGTSHVCISWPGPGSLVFIVHCIDASV